MILDECGQNCVGMECRWSLVRAGTIKADIAATYGLDQVTAAVTHAAKDAKCGKVLLKV